MILHSKRKAKGSAFERELVHLFWKNKWGAIRVAGSGSTTYPAPDIIAGTPGRLIVIEAKTSSSIKKYLSKHEVDQLIELSKAMGAESWISVKFKNKGIKFFPANTAKRTSNSVVVGLDDVNVFEFKELIS